LILNNSLIEIKKATAKVAYILNQSPNYFLLNQSFTKLGAIIVSTKEYELDSFFLTILIALVILFEPV
tara:strand:- start:965 stop:1168 length:204 start_codon:yes stop_codon:yes gene_type:complete